MINKVIIGILVLLVALAGGTGYYSYTLNQRIENLSGQLADFRAEQASQIDAVYGEIGALSQEK